MRASNRRVCPKFPLTKVTKSSTFKSDFYDTNGAGLVPQAIRPLKRRLSQAAGSG